MLASLSVVPFSAGGEAHMPWSDANRSQRPADMVGFRGHFFVVCTKCALFV